MSENVCRGCGAAVDPGRAWCPPFVRDCLAQYRSSADYRRSTMARDGHACARCGWWNRVVLADATTGRLRLLFAMLQLMLVPRARKVTRRGGWRTRIVDVDHIEPIGGKGTHSAWNMQVLCTRHHRAKTARDVAKMRGQRPPLDRAVVVRWAVLVVLVAVVGFQLLTPDLRNAVAVNPVNGLGLVVQAAAAPTVLVPIGALAVAVGAGVLLLKARRRVEQRLAESISEETQAGQAMKRAVQVKRWGFTQGPRLWPTPWHLPVPQPTDVIVRYPHTFRDDDPAKLDAIEGRVKAKLGWDSCSVEVNMRRNRMRLRFPDPFVTAEPTRSPLVGRPSNDLFDPLSVAVDERFRDVSVKLVERNVLVGGEPGGGKSNVLSLLLAGAFLDRNVEVWLMDGKEVEFPIWAPCAERMVVGADAEAHKRARAMLADLEAVIGARQALLREAQTEDSVTRKVEHGDGMGLIVLAIDELATYTTGWARKDVDEFVASLRNIIQRGRALGVVCILATQRPSADVVPTSIRDIVGFRWALRCLTPNSSDMVLGQGLASAGFNAARVPAEARGTGFLLAEGSKPRKVRAHYVDDADLVQLARQARILRGVQSARAAAGTSTD